MSARPRRHGTESAPTWETAPSALFASALGRPIDSAEVQAVLDALGPHVERPIGISVARYDPEIARTVAWDFPAVPRIWPSMATNLGVRDGAVVWLTVAGELVEDAREPRVSFRVPDGIEQIFRPQGAEWNWAPAIIRRRGDLLLDLDVGQGHWDGSYRFPLTPRQSGRLQADPLLYREVWEGLVRICQGRAFFDDPSTLPGSAQSLIDARCGRD
ncbi:hypothetical protein DY023_03370 [Microbacterium bovistercoris]|uniref:Uncharacterized protein n=1 Tax=Microbacterium bovistercoris TaxID=2293570 RepID=A0A371NX19_9MICO|nr:hypothetical protein [Microbacterium bovistercoris]REJ07683.1 hypothetical protein DY023_03370 [Microbacterium bovistercoris]